MTLFIGTSSLVVLGEALKPLPYRVRPSATRPSACERRARLFLVLLFLIKPVPRYNLCLPTAEGNSTGIGTVGKIHLQHCSNPLEYWKYRLPFGGERGLLGLAGNGRPVGLCH